MLALSDESAGTIEKFMEGKEMPYPIAAGSRSGNDFKISGYPSAFLLDHNGEVLWQGHPSGNEWVEMLPAALERAEAMADAWDPGDRGPELAKAVKAARAGDMGKAWKETDTLLKKFVEDPAATKKVETFRADYLDRAAERTKYAQSMISEARYFEAQQFLEQQMKLFKGAPPADAWKATMAEWKKEKSIKGLLSLDKKRMAAVQKARDGNKEKAVKDLRKLVSSAKSTRLDAVMRETLVRVQSM